MTKILYGFIGLNSIVVLYNYYTINSIKDKYYNNMLTNINIKLDKMLKN